MGIVEIPNELLEVVLRAKHSSDISTPGLIQKSMYYYLENFSLEKYLKSVEEVYTKKYLFAKELISNKDEIHLYYLSIKFYSVIHFIF